MAKKICIFLFFSPFINTVDLTLVGRINTAYGIGKVPESFFAACAQEKLHFNIINTRPNETNSEGSLALHQSKDTKPASVAIFTDVLWNGSGDMNFKKMPQSSIKFAFSTIESSAIPQEWVTILNNNFDGVLVPHEWLVDVYKKSGVKKPLFVLPLVIDIPDTIKRKNPHDKKFVFGCIAGYGQRKNQTLLLKAFHAAFRNNKNIILQFHSNLSFGKEYLDLCALKKKLGAHNVHISLANLTRQDYFTLLSSLDCYVLISKGEGYSFPAREAIALKIPCVLSNNTAHEDLCALPFVVGVETKIQEPALYESIDNRYLGIQYTTTVDSIKKALLDMYQNYNNYYNLALKDNFASQSNRLHMLSKKYASVIKPKKIVLSSENKIHDTSIETNSEELYRKYRLL